MSNKELIEDLNSLRIRYGTSNVYRTLIKVLRDEYEELSSLFCSSSNTHPTSTFYPSNPADYYSEFMKASAEAAHDTLQEYTPVPTTFYDLETESVNDESSILEAEELTFEEEIKLIDNIFNNIPYSEIPTENPPGESADTPQEPLLKIIQASGASAAPEAPSKKKLLKKKATAETVEVVKETPAPIKKKKTPPA
jgi:hypothetical protein